MTNVRTLHEIEDFLANVRRVVGDTLKRPCDEDQPHAPGMSLGAGRLMLQEIVEDLSVQ